MVSLKHSISLYISIPISYFTPLIPHHLPLSSHGFDPSIMSSRHSFETQPGSRPGLMIGSRVRWVDPGQLGSTKKKYHTLKVMTGRRGNSKGVF